MGNLVVVFSFAILMLVGVSSAGAYTIDGYIDDWGINLFAPGADVIGYLDDQIPSGGLDIDYIASDDADGSQEWWWNLIPGGSYYNYYDTEAIYFDNDLEFAYVAVVQGMPEAGHDIPGSTYPLFLPGDIAIDVGRDGIYEYGVDVSEHTEGSTTQFKEASSWADWEDVYYEPHKAYSNPWRIGTGGTAIGDPIAFAYSGPQGPGSEHGKHYVLEVAIPLSYLDLSSSHLLTIHWTQQCGNNVLNLEADVNPIPEPNSLMLLVTGLFGLGGFGLRRFRKSQG